MQTDTASGPDIPALAARLPLPASSAFNPTFGPHERWLLRANVRRDIWGMRGRWTGRDLVFA
jgi:hypothetical protein